MTLLHAIKQLEAVGRAREGAEEEEKVLKKEKSQRKKMKGCLMFQISLTTSQLQTSTAQLRASALYRSRHSREFGHYQQQQRAGGGFIPVGNLLKAASGQYYIFANS